MKTVFLVAFGLAAGSAWLLLKGANIDQKALGVGLGAGSYSMFVMATTMWFKKRKEVKTR